ncbi:Metacaspase-4 [Gracilariopsis chorda]|uniref:Metacaspase-4 n=1 Tax=Gracilariopsis chorda TaxID=448386 RepID=A0A2V3J6F2_9FLOR|nr:Metacaspase-4 [Gracilariopsis chorda]|eukprot:PXF50006.1 Metacaspase-4 [Gracilariopsis chorda]
MGKYAVIIGVNYVKNPEAALKGCCNDARIIYKLLESKGFEDENIKMLVDDDDDCDSPNHKNVKRALDWLCSDREEGDIIFMHFSGHGTQVPADDDDVETDNLDEAIVLEELFLMADDDLKQFFSKLPEGVRATVITDCCHSGSMLDGTEVAIEGAKDAGSAEPEQESASLLSILGGSRGYEVDQTPRSLPLSTICDVMGQRLGRSVEPTGSGVNGAMAQVFGGSAGKLMMKFALQQLNKSGGGNDNPLIGMLSSALLGKTSGSGGMSSSGSAMGGGGNSGQKFLGSLIGSLMGGGGGGGGGSGGGSGGGGNPLSSFFGGGSSNQTSSSSGNPVDALSGLMGDLGLESTTDPDAPQYNPSHQDMTTDVCTLITGCQSSETSADVRPPGGEAFGALTKTLTTVYERNPEISYYDLVSKVRQELSKGGFSQNPCLECSDEKAREVFIC